MKKNSNVSACIIFKGSSIDKLHSCINSLVKQTLLPQEIIIVGGERDLIGFKEKYFPNVKLLKIVYSDASKNRARNISIHLSTSDFILRIDYDMKAKPDLIEKCMAMSSQYDALIIPEKGKGGNFWENCRKLEKELVISDLDTVTPTFFRKSLFSKNENPFLEEFGALDEWGFNISLKRKNAKIGIVDTYFITSEDNLTLKKVIINKFKRGLWINNFMKEDKIEAWRRINPLTRGIYFYSKNGKVFFKDPIHFLGLITLKFIDFTSFYTGVFVGSYFKYHLNNNLKNYTLNTAENHGANYLNQMFENGLWSKYIDNEEKRLVIDILELTKIKPEQKYRILDVGMGPGRWSQLFVKYPFKSVVGIDFSKAMVDSARKIISDSSFEGICGDIENLDFPKESFEIIFSYRSFKYFNSQEKTLRKMESYLSKDGRILIEVPNKSIVNVIIKYITRAVYLLKSSNNLNYFYHVNLTSKAEMYELVRKTDNLTIVKDKPVFILPSIPFVKNILLSKIAINLDKLLYKILPKAYFARSWIYIIKRKS